MKDEPLAAGGGFDARCAPYLHAVEDRHFWFRGRNAILAPLVRQIEGALQPGYRILEVGCGTGNTLRLLGSLCTRGSLFGMDFQREGLQYARRRVSCPLIQGDARLAPFAPGVQFNMIGLFDVIEHIEDDTRTLAAIRSLLAANGTILLTVPAGPELWSDFDVAAGHCRRYSPELLHARLVDAGFRVAYLSPIMAGLYPVLRIARRVAGWRRSSGDPLESAVRELRVQPGVNGVLLWIIRREVSLVTRRRRLPFGSSLVAIAGRS